MLSDKQLRKIFFLMTTFLLFKIGGYFTISENIAITRVLKIIFRLTMTVGALRLMKFLKDTGHPFNFTHSNLLSPFMYYMYLLLGFASVLWSTDKGYSLLQLIMDIESLWFVYLYFKIIAILNAFYPKKGFRLSAFFCISVFIIGMIFLIGLWIDPDTFYRLTHGGDVARLGGLMMNPNELGMLAVLGLSMTILEWKFMPKWLVTIMFAASLYVLVLTGSRSSMIGFMLVIFYFIRQSDSVKLKAAVYVMMILSVPVIIQMIFIKQGDVEEVLSMTGRLPFWTALLTEGLPKEPWFGFGFMRIAYTDSFKGVHTYAGKMTHNTFIQVLMNLGFVGFTIVIFQMTFTIRAVIKAADKELKAFFVGVFIPIIINSFTEFGIFGETNYGILFYQFLIYLFVIRFNPNMNLHQKKRMEIRKISLPEQST